MCNHDSGITICVVTTMWLQYMHAFKLWNEALWSKHTYENEVIDSVHSFIGDVAQQMLFHMFQMLFHLLLSVPTVIFSKATKTSFVGFGLFINI
jgi:hypothetical protein